MALAGINQEATRESSTREAGNGEGSRAVGALGTRERILHEAALLFFARGYHGVSMREVAQAVGVSKPALYHHYADKEALFVAIMEDALQDLVAVLDSALREDSLRGQLLLLFTLVQRSAPRQRIGLQLAGELGHVEPQRRAAFEKHYREAWMGRLLGVLGAAQQRGELRSDLTAAALLSALLGLMYPLLSRPTSEDTAAEDTEGGITEQLLSVFFQGAAL